MLVKMETTGAKKKSLSKYLELGEVSEAEDHGETNMGRGRGTILRERKIKRLNVCSIGRFN